MPVYKGTSRERKEKREGKEMGQERIYRSAHTVTPKVAVELPFVGNTNLQVEMPLSEASRICESLSKYQPHPIC